MKNKNPLEKKTPAQPANGEQLPKLIRDVPELLPLYDWWKKDGSSTLNCILVAVVVALAVVVYRNHSRGQDVAGAAELATLSQPAQVDSPDSIRETADFEDAVKEHGSSKAGVALKLRLAKKLFDDGNYEDAFASYSEIAAAVKPDDPFYGFAQVGAAYSLEGQGKYAEAKDAFAAVAEGPFVFAAKLGAARNTAFAGAKDEALAALDALKAGATDDQKSRIETAEKIVKRFDPAAASLLSKVDGTDIFAQADLAAEAVAPAAAAASASEAAAEGGDKNVAAPEPPAPAAEPAPAPAPEAAPAAEPAPAPAA